MAEAELPVDVQEITFQWMQIASGVAQGRLAPEQGVTLLQALAEAHPEDREWLQDEIETIRRQFGLDVAERISAGRGAYWEKLRLVIEALLDERLDHERALALLQAIDAQHPEHTAETSKLLDGIADSPLRQLLKRDDPPPD
jgi:hypothetical protein